MHLPALLAASLPLAALAAPAADGSSRPAAHVNLLSARENLCSLKSPPQLCTPNASVTVEETALRAYKFYRAFVVDGDPRTMFSLIDNVYEVSLFCSGGCGWHCLGAAVGWLRARVASGGEG